MRKPRRRIKQIILGLGVLAVVAAIVWALMPHPIDVDVVSATRGPLEVEVREDGQTRVRDRYVVAAPLNGNLERITVKPGMTVEAGAVVAQITPPPPALLDDRARNETLARLTNARARASQAVAAVDRARESEHYAKTEADHIRKLFADGAVTGAERDRLESAEKLATKDRVAAEHSHAAVLSEIAALRAILEPRTANAPPFDVVAPTRGRVLRVMRESAGPVAAGAALLEVGDPSSLEVVVDVLSQDAERISPGMRVELGTAAARPIAGVVTLVEPSAFTRVSALGVEEQRVNVIVGFTGPASIGDGFRVDARIILWRGENVLRVPVSSLFRDRGQWALYVIDDGRARMRRVDVGHRGRVEVEITRGLEPGARVIVHPSDQVRDGVRVAAR